VVLEVLVLMGLCAPTPRRHLVTYHGVLAGAADRAAWWPALVETWRCEAARSIRRRALALGLALHRAHRNGEP
jgi:hypothetical protein